MEARLKFPQKHLKDSQTVRKRILWPNETKAELFGVNARRPAWRTPGTIHHYRSNTVRPNCKALELYPFWNKAGKLQNEEKAKCCKYFLDALYVLQIQSVYFSLIPQ